MREADTRRNDQAKPAVAAPVSTASGTAASAAGASHEAARSAPRRDARAACTRTRRVSVGPDYTLPQQAYVNAPLANHALDDANGTLVSRDAVPGNWWQLYDDPVLNGLCAMH